MPPLSQAAGHHRLHRRRHDVRGGPARRAAQQALCGGPRTRRRRAAEHGAAGDEGRARRDVRAQLAQVRATLSLSLSLILLARVEHAKRTDTGADLARSFLEMVRDAAFAFGPSFGAAPPSVSLSASTSSSSGPTAIPAPSSAPLQPGQQQQASVARDNFALNLGPVSLNVGGQAGNAIELGVDAARDGLRDVWGRVRERVEGVRLG